jgi:hypothetical protein
MLFNTDPFSICQELHTDPFSPVSITDLHASIYRAMGISPKLQYTVEERPFYVTKDGHGKPVMDLFA